jgi:hypothetical protein
LDYEMRLKIGLLALFVVLSVSSGIGQASQKLVVLADADSNFVRKFVRNNDMRFFYGLQGNNLSIGSSHDTGTELNGDLYRNTNDYIGAGITYGWLDGDLSFSLPGTSYLKEERANLKQFKLVFNYSRRKLAFRSYYTDNKGMVVSSSDNEFETDPSLHEVRLGVQVIYILNSSHYSYRASMYQTEYQMKTAGSWMLRFEPFYRDLGTKAGSVIPAAYDLPPLFGTQTGLEYVKAPGFLFMPGYGINIAIARTRYFISPILFAGVGVAYNTYRAKNGKESFTNLEYAANFSLNAGYNGTRSYAKLQFNWSMGYATLDPAYLTSSNLTLVFTYGFRFMRLKNPFKKHKE